MPPPTSIPRVHSVDPWLETGNRAHLSHGTGIPVRPAHRSSRLIARIAVDTVLPRPDDLKPAIPAEEIPILPSIRNRRTARFPVQFTGFA
jgi:hypothetical protein